MLRFKTSVIATAFLALLATDASAEFKIKSDDGSWMAMAQLLFERNIWLLI